MPLEYPKMSFSTKAWKTDTRESGLRFWCCCCSDEQNSHSQKGQKLMKVGKNGTWNRYMQMKHMNLQEARQLKYGWKRRDTEATQDSKCIWDSFFQLLVTFKRKEYETRQGMEEEAGVRGWGGCFEVEDFQLSS